MKHWETHPEFVEGCNPCKWATIRTSTETFTRERRGEGPDGDGGTGSYVRKMFAQRRAEGKPDPIPANKASAQFAPAAGPMGNTKKYKEANNGI